MQREDVEQLIAVLGNIRLEGVEKDCWAGADALRALLDRAERAEAERDAAFAAGQEEMRERAGRTADENTFGGGAVAGAICAVPIQDRPTSA